MAQTVDVDLINAFWQATREFMAVMGDLKVKRRRVFVKPDQSMRGRYYAVIGLTQGLTGNVAVCFSSELARFIAWSMFDEETADDDLLMDAIGEICNLCAGGGKKLLEDSEYTFEISPPTTLVNREEPAHLEVFNPAGTVCIVIECGISQADHDALFTIELAFQTEERTRLVARKQQHVLPQPPKQRD